MTSILTTTNETGAPSLAAARYGKDKVRVLRVVRSEVEGKDGKERWHDVVEYNVCALVEGEIETSFTEADNSVVVATDSSAFFSSYEFLGWIYACADEMMAWCGSQEHGILCVCRLHLRDG